MKVSVSTGLYYKKKGVEILDIIKEAGCDDIELFINQAFIDLSYFEIEKEICKRDMNVLSIHLPIPSILDMRNENEEEWIKRGLELSNIFDTDIIVTHSTYKLNVDGTFSSIDNEHLSNLIKYNNNGKFILTENNSILPLKSFTQGTSEFCDILEINNLSMTFDTTHWAYKNNLLLEGYELFKKFIKNIHISDYSNGTEHMAFGNGDLNLDEFVKNLKSEEYSYPLTIEFDFDNAERNDIKNNSEAIDKIAYAIEFIKQV